MANDPEASVTTGQNAIGRPRRKTRRLFRRSVTTLVAALVLWFGVTIWSVVRAPLVQPLSPLVINDVSQLNQFRLTR